MAWRGEGTYPATGKQRVWRRLKTIQDYLQRGAAIVVSHARKSLLKANGWWLDKLRPDQIQPRRTDANPQLKHGQNQNCQRAKQASKGLLCPQFVEKPGER